jgi:hypothetical protein
MGTRTITFSLTATLSPTSLTLHFWHSRKRFNGSENQRIPETRLQAVGW